jgi:hypothetical protein
MNNNDFFSINNLVEFGMGMAIAQQMVQTMNQTMVNMRVPGSFDVNNTQKSHLYYAIIYDKKVGPLSEMDVINLISEKKIFNETYMWRLGFNKWKLAENIPDIVKLVALSPPPLDQKEE